MTLHHENCERKKQWMFFSLSTQINTITLPQFINREKDFFHVTSLITIIVQLLKIRIFWVSEV